MILSAIRTGLRKTLENRRMIVVFYFANLLVGLLIMLPFRSALSDFASNTLMGEKLAGRFDMDFLFDFLAKNNGAISSEMGLMVIAAAVYWLLAIFLSGGAFSVFAGSDKYTPRTFWGSAAAYFGRFIRLALWSLPVLGIFYCVQFIETGIVRVIFGKDPYQYVTYWGGVVKLGLAQIGILFYFVVLDYSRIYVVLTDERTMRLALWKGIGFAFGNFPRTFGIAFTMFLTGVIVLIIYNPIADALHAPGTLIVLSLFVVQQLYMFLRMILKLTLFGGEMSLFRELRAPQEHVPRPDTSGEVGLERA